MHTHRFRDHLVSARPASAFVACPVALLPAGIGQPVPWEELYRRAYELAKAVNQPSRLDRLSRDLHN